MEVVELIDQELLFSRIQLDLNLQPTQVLPYIVEPLLRLPRGVLYAL